ncbi:MAG: sigma-70 family RNA polymerase sigma factor [Phycisphaerales bacterium]|nr:MAG: sigma-70 family RNA polymerase sigma factor [Phycisphaerales bacterium]
MAGRTWRQRKKGDWLRLLRSGDHEAFAEFIDKYKETVFMCCRRLGLNEDETEDVASETFLAVYRGLSRYSGKAELSTWLWSIAYRQAINYLRKNRRHVQLEAEADGETAGSTGMDPTAAVLHEETKEVVWKAVEELPRLWAMAVMLFYKEQKSIADIAKVMQVRHNTAKTYLFRGRERLKETLAPVFGEDSNADK